MLSQVVYETNADYFGSYEGMIRNTLVVADTTEKGILTFRFKESRTVFMLSPGGKLQVKWNDVSEKRTLFRLVRNLLVAKDNEKLMIKPLKQQAWIEYPVPESFKLYWCDKTTEFVLKPTPEKVSAQIEASKGDGPKTRNKIIEVKEALEELRHEFSFFREPTFNEVALRSGCLDPDTLRIGLALGKWKAQSSEDDRRTAEEAINLAGWLRFKEGGDLNPRLIALSNKAIEVASVSGISKARDILMNFPGLVPEITVNELRWPDETKTKWIQVFGCEPPLPKLLSDRTKLLDRLLADPNYYDFFHNTDSLL